MSDNPIETVGRVADAAKSISDTTRKALELASAFFAKVLGEDAAGIFRDAMFYFRARNAISLQEKLDKILENRQIRNPKAIPLRLAIPFLETATLEDDPTIQERWARLLANALDPSIHIDMERYYASVLKDLSPVDCLVVEKIASMAQVGQGEEITIDGLADSLGLPLMTTDISVCNLGRQNLIERKPKTGAPVGSVSTWVYKNCVFFLTGFGKGFVRACSETPEKWIFAAMEDDAEHGGRLSNPAYWERYRGP